MIKSFEMKRTIGELGALDRRELDERNRLTKENKENRSVTPVNYRVKSRTCGEPRSLD